MARQLQPIRYMHKVLMPQLRPLTRAEGDEIAGDFPRLGNRCGGVGCVHVKDTGDSFWILVESNAIQVLKCPRHPTKEMSLFKTLHKTDYNVNCTILYCTMQTRPTRFSKDAFSDYSPCANGRISETRCNFKKY